MSPKEPVNRLIFRPPTRRDHADASADGHLLRVLERVEARADVDPARIVFHGRSIGGSVACSAVHGPAPADSSLQSTFTEPHTVACLQRDSMAPERIAKIGLRRRPR